jgi:M6 family metalloprotease-like protein
VDPKGFTVIRDRKWYVYARMDQVTGRLVSTGLRVGLDNPAANGVQPGAVPSPAARAERARSLGFPLANAGEGDGGEASGPSLATQTSGSLKNLVVLIRWSDHAGRTLPSAADVDVLMNNVGPDPSLAPTGSVRDVYLENSYGALSLDSTVADWVTSDNTEAYYANGNSGLTSLTHAALKDALNKVDATVDFRDFDTDGDGLIDAITFLHSGYGAEWGGNDAFGRDYVYRMWSHKWSIFGGWTSQEGVTVSSYHISPAVWGTSGSNIGRIGVIAHETGHFLGLPDLYDTDGGGDGIGSFGLMANSWGFDGSQLYPPHMCPWSKIQLGWLSPTVIDAAGSYTLNQVESSPETYRIDLGYPSGEYLLIENRQPVGFDASPSFSQGGGLAIYHIDEAAGYNSEGYPTASGWSGSHYKIALLQADGWYDLEHGWNRGDEDDTWHAGGEHEITVSVDPNTGPYPNTDSYQGNVFVQTNNRIYDISASGPSMTFSFEVVGTPTVPPADPSNLVANAVSYDQVNLSWSDNSGDESTFRIERSLDGVGFSEIASVAANTAAYSDAGLSPSTTIWYRVRASNVTGNSGYTNTASATTNPPPPPPANPSGLVAAAASDVAIDLSWSDNSSDEDDFLVRRSVDGISWVDAAAVPAGTTAWQDSGLDAATTYTYQVFSRSAWGQSGSNTASATTDPPPSFVDTIADEDINVSGSVEPAANGYLNTHDADEVEQIITEEESGGRPTRRRSFAEHRWRFPDVRGGLGITLFVNAWAPANSEGDDFDFEVSLDGGGSWSTLLTVPAGSAPNTVYSAELPTSDPGTMYVRVVDTDSTQGARSLDSVHVDQLFLRTDLDPADSPPTPPANLQASAVSASEVQLIWADNSNNERGFRVYRAEAGEAFSQIATAPVDATSFLDQSAAPNMSYDYQVEAYTASFSALSNTVQVTTPDGIALSGTGRKQKGKAVADLTWSGGSSASTVDIWRSVNGGAFEIIDTVSNNGGGSYTDPTGLKGAPTLQYQVCSPESPPKVCSDTILIAF